MKHIAVIDIGKTNVKLALVDLPGLHEIKVLTRPNTVIHAPPYPHFDTDAIWSFLKQGLAALHREYGIDAISVTTHGACGALLASDGSLAAPVLDYEHFGPETTRAAYDQIRPPFRETGSPALPMGLNLGAQLFWQFDQDPDLKSRTAQIVTWPQYWGYCLTGNTATDVCSLGSHTDLWDPYKGAWSSLVEGLGLAQIMARAQRPSDRLGTLLLSLQQELGLGPVPVLTGIHDSNASLVPHLGAPLPFCVVSTGTWVICMAMGAPRVDLDPARDTLVNVNAHGQAVPSARFMGGREYEMIMADAPVVATVGDATRVVARRLMLLPSVVSGCGPFADRVMEWSAPNRDGAETEVALGFYLALMTAECLENIGADGPILIEGPFGANPWFCQMLQAATGRAVVRSRAKTGTAIGAAMLFLDTRLAYDTPARVEDDPAWIDYAASWRSRVMQNRRSTSDAMNE